MKPIFVSASAFGAEQVLAEGHAHFAKIVAAAGCSGIEVRRELFSDAQMAELAEELSELRHVLENERLTVAYSFPMELWQPDGRLNRDVLVQAMQEARQLGAILLKTSLGHYQQGVSDLQELQQVLTEHSGDGNLRVTVENDQTPYGGNVQRLQSFFTDCQQQHVRVGMTFDIGNWQWTGEQALQAANRLREYVVYVHAKHVEDRGDKLVTLPLPDRENAFWREVLDVLPSDVPRAIEFPLQGEDLVAVTRLYAERLTTESLIGGKSVW